MLNNYLLLCLILINSQLIIGQEKNIFEYLPDNNEHLIYHDDWGKNNYIKLLHQFNSSPLKKDDIVFLGNSITAEGKNWSARLNNPKVRNRGIGGDTTDGVLARIGEIVDSKPTAVFLLIGINDLYNNSIQEPSVNYIANNIIEIAKKIKTNSSDSKVFIQTLLPISKKKSTKDYKLYNHSIRTINEIIIENQQKKFYSVIDLYALFVNSEGQLEEDLTYDGLHLNEEGYKVWSNFIKPIIDSL
ncbi:MAG: GDSL family lipase [Flavobacteriaceae bacterium]|jgi:lysophospholipase L1-like esterase|nr:GDSL family lipase [Flavobacteriaceae bacterium]MBL6679011.1 GDSL family lipase [Flavobacteriaceae bacterium]